MSLRKWLRLGAVVALGLSSVTIAAAPAQAATPSFQAPFPCGQQWKGATRSDHVPSFYAVDFNRTNDEGDPVVASLGGTAYAIDGGDLGNYVDIHHGGGWVTRYAHFSDWAIPKGGVQVAMGQVIGYVGSTGNSTGAHLHYEQRLNDVTKPAVFNGKAFDYGNDAIDYVTSANCSGGGDADVYGVLSDGRLTYARIDDATGNRTHGNVVSSATLGFTPKAMATLNYNTILVTSTGGALYRVDVSTNNTSLGFTVSGPLATGWTHDLLAFDGSGGHLFGIADGTLRRYDVTASKPTAANIINNTAIGTGFTLATLTATGPNWLLGTTSTGVLRSYRINAGSWNGATLDSAGWNFAHLVSPGRGIYLGHTSTGGMYHYRDADPYDFSGSDLQYFSSDPVDTSGWTQILLSAQPES